MKLLIFKITDFYANSVCSVLVMLSLKLTSKLKIKDSNVKNYNIVEKTPKLFQVNSDLYAYNTIHVCILFG